MQYNVQTTSQKGKKYKRNKINETKVMTRRTFSLIFNTSKKDLFSTNTSPGKICRCNTMHKSQVKNKTKK